MPHPHFTDLRSPPIKHFKNLLLVIVTALAPTLFTVPAAAQNAPAIGIVVMHGKGGSPTARHMTPFVVGLESKGLLVANLEMPWSGRRDYDTDVATAEAEVTAALNAMRSKGAKKVFVAGHSQGGVFASHYASKYPVDGAILIAPGGNVANTTFRQQLGSAVDQARKMVAEGKGSERGTFMDYEGAKGTFPVHTTAAIYMTWFDPEGAMNQEKSTKAIPPSVPVLYIGPTNDYPALQRIKQSMFALLPANPQSKLYEPSSDHRGAPRASTDEIIRWTTEVAAR